MRNMNRLMLWVSAALVAAFAFFPSYVNGLAGTGPEAIASGAAQEILAGEWIGSVTLEDSTTVHVVVDLGLADRRFTGEFDVMDWGVENYPVEVGLTDSTVQLHFAGPNADFVEAFSGDSLLVGTVSFEDTSLPLAFRRAGKAQFSETFLALERAADDSSLVEQLSSSGEELRRQFNADAGKTRLVMLLSPT